MQSDVSMGCWANFKIDIRPEKHLTYIMAAQLIQHHVWKRPEGGWLLTINLDIKQKYSTTVIIPPLKKL